ncbi:hypothetical protein [Anaerosolibacter carboniphilus]|nr:hypothetical protein [Anaerosolibacter carboniphilus]
METIAENAVAWLKRGDAVRGEKQLGMSLRFIYGYLKGFIAVAILYVVVALTIILLDPKEFSLFVLRYVQTEEYSQLKVTLWGHGLMLLFGLYELLLLKAEKRKKKRRRV